VTWDAILEAPQLVFNKTRGDTLVLVDGIAQPLALSDCPDREDV